MYYQVDLLSRRSLLIRQPAPDPQQESVEKDGLGGCFILSSTRSTYAREQGVSMKALLGGEGGVIGLNKLRVSHGVRLDRHKSAGCSYEDSRLLGSSYTSESSNIIAGQSCVRTFIALA